MQPAKKIEVVCLESTEEQVLEPGNEGSTDKTDNNANVSAPADMNLDSVEEEHDPAPTSPAKSSISSLHANVFHNPSGL